MSCQIPIAIATESDEHSGRTLTPGYCVTEAIDCFCYTLRDGEKIAELIKSARYCEIELYQKTQWIETHRADAIKSPWYKETSVIIGGVAISFAVGSLVTYLIVR